MVIEQYFNKTKRTTFDKKVYKGDIDHKYIYLLNDLLCT